jgi:Ca2+-binding EF-hand superfamily protein
MRHTSGMPPMPHLRRAALALPLMLASGMLVAGDYPHTPSDYLRQMDANDDGRIGTSEYVAYMSRGFVRMDRDGDDVLEAAELPGGRGREVSLKSWQADLRRQFHRLDRNHDGYLDARELSAPPG